MAQKKIPARQCIGCMTSRPKKELVRVVRAPSGEISIDLVGKKPGRGAYLCPTLQVFRFIEEVAIEQIKGQIRWTRSRRW